MDNMEIQREAIIEIVGTEYEGRAVNHDPQFLQQGLILKHQSDNPHDHNAVLLLTEGGKELGYLPKGFASLYAPAIDSGRYTFSIEIVKAEPDPQRPILIVKIISELSSHSEEEIESDIFRFVQDIVNDYALKTKEYLAFIHSETVNVDELLSALDRVRLIQKLLSCSNDIIENRGIKPNSDEFTLLTKDSLVKQLSEIKADVSDVLKKIQKAYNESLDIDDEEEYHRVQSEIRVRRKKFRQYEEILTSSLDTVTSYVNTAAQPHSPAPEIHDAEPENAAQKEETISAVSEPEKAGSVPPVTNAPASENYITPQFTEQAFFEWLVSKGGISESTAKQYISNIHNIEKLYQTLFGVRRHLLGAPSAENARSTIEELIQRSEYIDANERRHNIFGTSLSKFAQFADISVAGLKNTAEKKSHQPPVSTRPYVIKTVDFENPHSCTYYKPCSFILNEQRHPVGSWRELYAKFLTLLYTDNTHSEIIKGLNGRSLFGRCIDFADNTLAHKLRSPIRVAADFFAEGNLSAIDVIKRIKCLMKLCAIDDAHMIIEYSTQEEDTNTVLPENGGNNDNGDTKDFEQPVTEPEQTGTSEKAAPAPVSFTPDTTKPFVLKDALTELLLTDAPEITKYREYKGGISSKNFRGLIKAYYGKTVGLFELSKLLMLDRTFQSVGKGCYIVNKAAIHRSEPELVEKDEPVKLVTEPVPAPDASSAHEVPAFAEPAMPEPLPAAQTVVQEQADDTADTENGNKLTIEPIIAVMKDNCDNLQYEDGFGAYEVKTLLSQKGYTDLSEEEIEALMSGCAQLREIEDGYYTLAEGEDNTETTVEMSRSAEDNAEDTASGAEGSLVSVSVPDEPQQGDAGARHIILRLNGNVIRAYDYSDALDKVCEFSINCKPFRMARIAEQAIQIHGNNVFYRKPVHVDGYHTLSNGLQITAIATLSELQTITAAVKKYCQIDDDMIAIISR